MNLPALKRAMLALVGALAAMLLAAPAMAQEAAGTWLGSIEPAPGSKLPLVIHIKRDGGGFTGTMDSPAQGVQGLPLTDIAAQDGKLTFNVPSVGGTYKGQWDPGAKAWKGEWGQAGQSWPLSFGVRPPPPVLNADWLLPPNDDIAKLVAARNAPRPGQGIVVGVLSPEGRRIVAGGTGAGATFDGNTLFEIGSISKVFTALILADMVNKGEVSLDDPAAKYLPAGHKMPERNGRQITLRDLSTHRSGLPRMPSNMRAMSDPDGPFADYDEPRMLAFLDGYTLTRDIGAEWEYSNLGVGLLGYLLARAANTDFETLLRTRITGPLGMKDTMITLPPSHAGRLAPGFDEYMRPARAWDVGVLTAAGGIRSSAADMLIFAQAVLDPKSPIAAAMKTALAARVPGANPRTEQALGWVILHPAPGRELLLHDGGTGGFRALLALEPAKARAVVVLINSAPEPSVGDLGLHLLIGTPVSPTPPIPPAPPPAVKRTAIAMPVVELEKFAGRYDFGSGFTIAVTRQGDGLFVRREGIPGATGLQILPEGPLAFFWKDMDAQIVFTADASGAIIGAELTQGIAKFTGKRIAP